MRSNGRADRPGVSAFYRAVMLELERRRLQLGLSMDALSDLVGFADRLYGKLLHVDSPSGRQAKWATVDEMLECMMPDGYDVEVRPRKGPRLSAFLLRHRVKNAATISDRKLQRELMREIGKKGGAATAAKLPRWKRIAIAKAANRKRNERLTAEQRSALARHAACARNAGISPEERKEAARRAAAARWGHNAEEKASGRSGRLSPRSADRARSSSSAARRTRKRNRSRG